MKPEEIEHWLRESRPGRLERLWRLADRVRRQQVGGRVRLRGLVEFSNHCRRRCHYCGLRAPNRRLPRYRMSQEEILVCARRIRDGGISTVVLQSGEDGQIDADWLYELVHRIKLETALTVTLSVGERSPAELEYWRRAGADRYLLKFESSNPRLYRRYHPPGPENLGHRLEQLEVIRSLGYETGSGAIVGLPGQTFSDLARDLELLAELQPDMIALGPYVPHPDTPLGRRRAELSAPAGEQVPADAVHTLRAVALARLLCPAANIPATSALAVLTAGESRRLALARGANVVMVDMTPERYRFLYDIYPGKAEVVTPQEWFTGESRTASSLARVPAPGRTAGEARR